METTFFIAVLALLLWVNRHNRQRLATLGVATILAVTLAVPPQAKAVGIVVEIQTILATINTKLGGFLTAIEDVENQIRDVQQTTVTPVKSILQIHALSSNWRNIFEGEMRQLFSLRTTSATQPFGQQLEQNMTDGNGGTFSALNQSFQNVFGKLPGADKMHPQGRDMTDMDDALAEDTLEQLKRGDQVNEAIRETGDSLEDIGTSEAPGAAPFLTATALVTMLKSNAVTQKMLAAYLRQAGAQLAHETAVQKQSVLANVNLRDVIGNIGSR